MLLYIRIPFMLEKKEYKVCDELTDEIIAIFYDHQKALDYLNWLTNKQETF